MNRTVFLIFFIACLLITYQHGDFIQNELICNRNFLVESKVLYISNHTTYKYICFDFFLLYSSLFIAVDKTSNIILNRHGKSRHHCLVHILAYLFWVSLCSGCQIWDSFILLLAFHIPILPRSFVINGCCIVLREVTWISDHQSHRLHLHQLAEEHSLEPQASPATLVTSWDKESTSSHCTKR